MARLRYNGLSTTLGASLTTSATAVTFGAALTHSGGTNVPTIAGSDYIPLTILDSTGKASEIVYLTAYTSGATSGTITRAQEGTTGVAHASGDKVVHGPTVYDISVVRDRKYLAAAGTVSIDEFNDDSLDTAWVRVDGTGAVAADATWTESGDVLSVRNAGNDGSQKMHALMRPIGTAMAAGDGFITCMNILGRPGTNYSMGGLVVADGATFGSGNQISALAYLQNTAVAIQLDPYFWTGYNTVAAVGTEDVDPLIPYGQFYQRLWMPSANNWQMDVSPDGVSWLKTGYGARTCTPTHVGFLSSSYGSGRKHVIAYEFLRRVSGVTGP